MNRSLEVKIAAMDVFNRAMQREIEAAESQEIALELAQIKFVINQQFDREKSHDHTPTNLQVG